MAKPYLGADRASPYPGSGGIYIGDYEGDAVVLPRSLALRHGLILGPTGSGKSYGFFLPNLTRSTASSLVCTDPKSELWRLTSHLHPGRAVRYAPTEPQASAAFNWVPLCKNERMAERIARAIVESGNTGRTEQVWLDLEAGFLAALFSHTATLDDPTPLTAYYLIARQSASDLLLELEQSESAIAREQANLLRQTTERVRGSVIPVVAARLQFLRDPDVARFTSTVKKGPRFERLRREACVLYWCQSEQDMARLRPLSAAFFTVLIEQLLLATASHEAAVGEGSTEAALPHRITEAALPHRITEAASTRSVSAKPHRYGLPVTLLLDEFAAVGPIPDFDTLIAVARGRGLSFWLGLQSLAQLETRYSRPVAQTILTNCVTKLILPGLDVDSAEYVSRSLGQETRAAKRRSWNSRFFSLVPSSRTTGDFEHARALLTADEVRRLPETQHLAIVSNLRPIRLSRSHYPAVQ